MWRQSFGWSRKEELYRFARQGGPQEANALKTVWPTLEGVVRSLTVFKEQGVISSWTFFWLVGGEVIGTQHYQPSGSNRSGVSVLVGSVQLTSSTWWEFQYLQNSSKEMAQNIIYSPWGGTKGPWLCLMAKVLLFCLAWLFSFLSAFSHFSDLIYSFLKKLFIYLFLASLGLRCWVFVAVRGLSLVAASRGYSSLRCVGFSLRWLLFLQSMGSRRMGFSSCGTQAQ